MPKRGRGFGGPGGGAGGMGGGGNAGMMKQLQKMQEDMAKAQEALATETVETEAGGIIKVVMSCHQRLQSLTIDKDKLDMTDAEWLTDLQDLIGIAVNQAIEKSQERAAERMEAVSSGLSGMLPPGLGGLLG
ncbi:MAG: YbaB/EbfC family nucleoid-associated protein [Aggregatilineales bacterium]